MKLELRLLTALHRMYECPKCGKRQEASIYQIPECCSSGAAPPFHRVSMLPVEEGEVGGASSGKTSA